MSDDDKRRITLLLQDKENHLNAYRMAASIERAALRKLYVLADTAEAVTNGLTPTALLAPLIEWREFQRRCDFDDYRKSVEHANHRNPNHYIPADVRAVALVELGEREYGIKLDATQRAWLENAIWSHLDEHAKAVR